MSNQYFLICIALLALGTFLIRSSFILLSGKFESSKNLQQIFSYIPAAILPALFTPMVFFHSGQVDYLWGKERFFILIASIVVCVLTKFSMLATIVFGLSLHYLLIYF